MLKKIRQTGGSWLAKQHWGRRIGVYLSQSLGRATFGTSRKDRILQIGISVLILLVGVIIWPATSKPAFANQTTPPVYAHSWYITDPSNSGMQNLADRDASWTQGNCSGSLDSMVVLAFGQPGTWNGVYGVFDHAPGSPFISDAQVTQAAEQYMTRWYNDTNACPRLHVVIGLNNYHECVYSPCSIYTAGQKWAGMLNTLASWLNSQNYAWQITAWAGDDMETGWDSASATRQFVDGFNNQDNCSCLFVDFGDAWQHSGWTDTDVYYVAWGATYDVPLPEIYDTGGAATNRWTQVRVEYYMFFYGVMTECSGSDPLPTGSCWVSLNGDYENAPNQAWWQLWNTLNANGVGQSTLNYSTNVKWP